MSAFLQSVNNAPDAFLIQRSQDGNFDAFDQLYKRHHDGIHGVISAMIPNSAYLSKVPT